MTCRCSSADSRPPRPPSPPPGPARPSRGRAASLALLTAIAESPGSLRGTAVFMLECECLAATVDGPPLCDSLLEEIGRRLRAVAPVWHRLTRWDGHRFVVIAQGLVDGAGVLGAAARLVHAFDDALHLADLPFCPEVSIGIASSSQPGATPQSLLAAAEASLAEAMAANRGSARGSAS